MEITKYDVFSNVLWAIINTYIYVILVLVFNHINRQKLQRNLIFLFFLLNFVVEFIQKFALLKFPTRFFSFSVLDPAFFILRAFIIVLFFDTKLWKALTLVLFYYAGLYFSYVLMANLLSLRTTLTLDDGFPFYSRMMHEMSLTAVVVLFFYVIILLIGISRRRKIPPQMSTVHGIGILLPSCLYITAYFIIFPYMINVENADFPFVIGIVMFVLNVASFILIVDADRKNIHLYYLDKQYQKQNQYFSAIKESNLAIQKYAHDERKHYSYIMGLLMHGEYDKIKEYLSSLNKRDIQADSIVITGNIDIDIILNAKVAEAKDAGCNIIVNGNLPGRLEVDPVDFCILIGNCLDNAIAACLKTYDKEIKVTFTYYKKLLFIKVQNAYIPSSKNTSSENSKKIGPKFGSGLGLGIMTSVAKRYNGYIEIAQKNNIFTTEAVLNAPLAAKPEKVMQV